MALRLSRSFLNRFGGTGLRETITEREPRKGEQPWAKIYNYDVKGNSSWVSTLQWIPLGSARGNIWFTTKEGTKRYVVPDQSYGTFLILVDETNAPDNGVGSDMWREGFFRGAKRNFGREQPEIRKWSEIFGGYGVKGARQADLSKIRKFTGLWRIPREFTKERPKRIRWR